MNTPQKIRIAVLISGRGSNMESLIRACGEPNYPAQIVLVVSNKHNAPGLEKAKKAGIMTKSVGHKEYTNRIDFENELHNIIEKQNVDLICLGGFMRVLGPEFVNKWTDRILNIHPSLLPEYPGLDTYARAIADQRAESGCTVHVVTADLDAGPIILQKRVPILPQDTPETLSARILEQEHIAYPAAVRIVAENLLKSPRPKA